MKESRFIELLNLYIDQQISPAEAAELEVEIARSPAHHRTYLQYCRMHRACVMLFENFQVPPAPLAQALDQAEGKVTTFPARRFRVTRAAGVAGLAVAAACIAFVVVNQTSPVAQVRVPAESFHVAVADAPARAPEFHTVFTARKLAPADNRLAVDTPRMAFDWMNQIELSPMAPVSDRPVMFTIPAESASTDLRFRPARGSAQPAVEMTAFEFQQ
ncbi:MAG TPA: hypothetical protein VMI53_09925 [Opitutaceae bacterium]|nr:hypothetical protein [Opitutaceae bacterium]